MILGFVIDEHGNLITGQEIEQFQANLQKWLADQAAVWQQITEAVEQVAAALVDFGNAFLAACQQVVGALPREWLSELVEPDLEYLELAYQRYARWYNAWHPGRKVSWRRLNFDQRREAQWRFA